MTSSTVNARGQTEAAGWIRREPLALSDFTGRAPVLALCRPVDDLDILDLGCGEGFCARQLKQWGARRVVGVDASPGLISAAREAETQDRTGIQYRCLDVAHLAELEDASFDLVLVISLFNQFDLAQTRAVMKEVMRLVRRGGKFIFSVTHPSFPFVRPPQPPHYFDVGSAGYFTARGRRHAGAMDRVDGMTVSVQLCHKTFEDYFDALRGAGFDTLPVVKELSVTDELIARHAALCQPLADVPLHVAFAIARQ